MMSLITAKHGESCEVLNLSMIWLESLNYGMVSKLVHNAINRPTMLVVTSPYAGTHYRRRVDHTLRLVDFQATHNPSSPA